MDAPELHLKDELPNHALLGVRCERPADRKFPSVKAVDVWIPLVLILKMSAVDVRERGYSQPDHVGSGPQQIAVEELGAPGIEHRGICACNRVSRLLHLPKRVIDPSALYGPACYRGDNLTQHAHLLRYRR